MRVEWEEKRVKEGVYQYAAQPQGHGMFQLLSPFVTCPPPGMMHVHEG
jgi:hypothetical protein